MTSASSLTRCAEQIVVFMVCTVAAAVVGSPVARSDATAYLVNVTVRPGYSFANAEQALAYGQHICSQVGAGDGYRMIIGRIKSDFATSDDYQASYLVTQAVNELCPAMIWQLRNSAAHQGQRS